MTLLATLLVLAVVVTVAVLAGRLGADTRPMDPSRYDAQWPFVRHDG